MSLWRHRDFLKLWIGETVSVLGSQVTQLALPLAAAVMLHATPVQMGILGAADTAPFLLIALFAGAWVDRMHRRRVMIVADFGRALLLGVVPVAYLAGWLSLELLHASAARWARRSTCGRRCGSRRSAAPRPRSGCTPRPCAPFASPRRRPSTRR